MSKLLHMWKYPKMVAWFIAAALLWIAFRLPFMGVPMLYGFVEFLPGAFLIPLAGIFWGPAGAAGIFVGSLLGDALLGFWNEVSVYRAIGYFLWAVSAKKLWDFFSLFDAGFTGFQPTLRQTGRFLAASLPGAFCSACWQAFGIHNQGAYPFAFALVLVLLPQVVFIPAFGSVAYRFFARELVPAFGCWRTVMKDRFRYPSMGLWGAIVTLLASFAAPAIGYYMDTEVYGHDPFAGFTLGSWGLGTSGGGQVTWWVSALLAMHAFGLFWPRKNHPSRPFPLTAVPALVMALVMTAPAEPRVPTLPSADRLLSEVRAALPATPLVAEAELISPTSGDRPANSYKVKIYLQWRGENSFARYEIFDAFGAELHRVLVRYQEHAAPLFSYGRGDPSVPAEMPGLNEEIEDSNFTWMDLSFSFLWWPGGRTVAYEPVKERDCYAVEIPVPSPGEDGVQAVRLWIEPNLHVFMRAAALDATGGVVRKIEVESIKKINGIWTVKDVEVENCRTDTRTRLKVRQIREAAPEDRPALE